MKERGMRVVLLLVMAAVLAGCSREVVEAEALVVALKPDRNADAMEEDRKELETYLEEQLGIGVEVIIPASGAVIEQGLANGTVDVAWLSSTGAARYSESGYAELLLATEIEGRTTYESYWVVPVDSPHRAIEDLRGRPVAFASPTSTSGYLIPLWDLNKRGLIDAEGGPQAFFGADNVLFGTGYVSAIEQVFAGQAEAAAVSDYVIDEDKHLVPEQKARLRVLQSQGPVPTHTLSVRPGLSEERKQALKAALLAMDTRAPALRDRLFTSRLVDIEEAEHLAPIREALAFAASLER